MRILVVEDDEQLRNSLDRLIRERAKGTAVAEIDVIQAGTLEEALSRIDGVDAVLCDACFPADRDRVERQGMWFPVWWDMVMEGGRFGLFTGSKEEAERARWIFRMGRLGEGYDQEAFVKPWTTMEAVEFVLGVGCAQG